MHEVEFDPQTLIQGIKNIFYTPAEAVADIIDNSIEAQSKNIHIIFSEGTKQNVGIVDDGCGMSKLEIKEALNFKKTTNLSDKNLSKYGWGLKSASISQCENTYIISKKK